MHVWTDFLKVHLSEEKQLKSQTRFADIAHAPDLPHHCQETKKPLQNKFISADNKTQL